MSAKDIKSVITYEPKSKESTEALNLKGLTMGVWYNSSVAQDSEFAEQLMSMMKALGCTTERPSGSKDVPPLPLSPEGMIPGQDAKYEAETMFEKADIVHVVLSRASLTTPSQDFVKGLKGIKSAEDGKLETNVFIVPVLIDSMPLPSMYSGRVPVDLSGGDGNANGEKLLRTWQYAANMKKK